MAVSKGLNMTEEDHPVPNLQRAVEARFNSFGDDCTQQEKITFIRAEVFFALCDRCGVDPNDL